MNNLDVDFIESLVSEEDPFPLIWDSLNRIWSLPRLAKSKDFDEIWQAKEQEASTFEEMLFKVYFEIYDKLAEKGKESQLKKILQQDEYAIVIMDGLSIREANLLLHSLKRANFKIKDYSFSFSSIPSDTETFCKDIFGFSHPSQMMGRKSLGFQFAHVVKDEDIRDISGDRIVFWSIYPDGLLHVKQKGRFEPLTMNDVLHRTEGILLKILQNIGSDHIIITSDHGYLYYKYETWWMVGKEYENLLRKTFGQERAKPITEVDTEILEKFRALSPEAAYTMESEGNLLTRGRFSWSAGRASPIRHGGVSLMEMMLPVISLRKE